MSKNENEMLRNTTSKMRSHHWISFRFFDGTQEENKTFSEKSNRIQRLFFHKVNWKTVENEFIESNEFVISIWWKSKWNWRWRAYLLRINQRSTSYIQAKIRIQNNKANQKFFVLFILILHQPKATRFQSSFHSLFEQRELHTFVAWVNLKHRRTWENKEKRVKRNLKCSRK